MEFPVDVLATVSHEDLVHSAEDYMSDLLYSNPDNAEHFSLPNSRRIPLTISNVGFVPFYGSDLKHKALALFSPEDQFTAVALYLGEQWWAVEDILKTADPSRKGLLKVRSLGEKIVMYVLNRIVYRSKEMSQNEVPFLCHSANDYAKILWKNGEAVGFYSVKPTGSLCNSFLTQRYLLPVMDSIFVRKIHRGNGHGLQILEDFVDSFKEDSLGLKYPVSQAMLKVCGQYLNTYPADRELLWEVESVGGPFHRCSIASKLQSIAVSGFRLEDALLNENDVAMEEEVQKEKSNSVEVTEVTMVNEHLRADIEDMPVAARTRGRGYGRKRIREEAEVTEESLPDKITRVDDSATAKVANSEGETPEEEGQLASADEGEGDEQPDEEVQDEDKEELSPANEEVEEPVGEETAAQEEENLTLEVELLAKVEAEQINGNVTDDFVDVEGESSGELAAVEENCTQEEEEGQTDVDMEEAIEDIVDIEDKDTGGTVPEGPEEHTSAVEESLHAEQASTAEEAVPTEEEQTSPAEEAGPTEEEQTSPAEEAMPTEQEQTSPAEEAVPTEEEQTSPAEEAVPTEEEQTSSAEEAVPTEEEQTSPAEEAMPIEEEQTSPADTGLPTEQEQTSPAEEAMLTEEEQTSPAEEAMLTEEEQTSPAEEAVPTEEEQTSPAEEAVPTEEEQTSPAEEAMPTEQEKTSPAEEAGPTKEEQTSPVEKTIPTEQEQTSPAEEAVPTEQEQTSPLEGADADEQTSTAEEALSSEEHTSPTKEETPLVEQEEETQPVKGEGLPEEAMAVEEQSSAAGEALEAEIDSSVNEDKSVDPAEDTVDHQKAPELEKPVPKVANGAIVVLDRIRLNDDDERMEEKLSTETAPLERVNSPSEPHPPLDKDAMNLSKDAVLLVGLKEVTYCPNGDNENDGTAQEVEKMEEEVPKGDVAEQGKDTEEEKTEEEKVTTTEEEEEEEEAVDCEPLELSVDDDIEPPVVDMRVLRRNNKVIQAPPKRKSTRLKRPLEDEKTAVPELEDDSMEKEEENATSTEEGAVEKSSDDADEPPVVDMRVLRRKTKVIQTPSKPRAKWRSQT